LGEKGLIWYKRDLRVRDHAALTTGRQLGATSALFIYEPAWLQSPECSSQHVAFAQSSLAELTINLASLGVELLVREGKALDVLNQLLLERPFTHLLSHEETGSGWSYQRDIAVGVCARGMAGRNAGRRGWMRLASMLNLTWRLCPSRMRANKQHGAPSIAS
jgi:deoxyribodipyrimidine photo-lyase